MKLDADGTITATITVRDASPFSDVFVQLKQPGGTTCDGLATLNATVKLSATRAARRLGAVVSVLTSQGVLSSPLVVFGDE